MAHDKVAVGPVWTDNHIKEGVQGPLIYDTQHHHGQVALKTLVLRYLDYPSFNWHNPVEDAKAAMLLFLRHNPYQGRTTFYDAPRSQTEYEAEFPSLK